VASSHPSSRARPPVIAAAAALAAAVTIAFVFAAGGEAAAPGCASFRSQAAAQEYLLAAGGGPGRPGGRVDGDRDGVACEGTAGPYKGFATIRYSAKKKAFFGTVTMPPDPLAGGFACLEGNRRFPDGPRVLTIYRERPGPDRVVVSEVRTEARPESGRLFWKDPRRSVPRGLYYAEFEARIPLTPYGGNDCPGFRSRPALLPPLP
jgi:hypothetical protein